jgi:hypothetical protein
MFKFCKCYVCKMLSRKRLIKKKLLLLSLSATLLHVGLAQQQRRKRPSCWERDWISRRPTHGFTATLVRELEFENGAEFRIMFRMDVDTFENLLIMVAPKKSPCYDAPEVIKRTV